MHLMAIQRKVICHIAIQFTSIHYHLTYLTTMLHTTMLHQVMSFQQCCQLHADLYNSHLATPSAVTMQH